MRDGAFYIPTGDLLAATDLTRGPWDPRVQHAGPPAGLLARAIETAPGGRGRRIARITCEILHPVPVSPLRATAEVIRSGGRIDLVDARLTTSDGSTVMMARAWRLPAEPIDLPAHAVTGDPAPAAPETGRNEAFFPTPHEVGYHTAMEWRFITGAWRTPGPATVWLRMTVPLVGGETPSPLQRVLIAADSGSGAAASLDPHHHLFPNVDLTVHLTHDPAGEWIGLSAASTFTQSRTGITHSTIYDTTGPVGSAVQTLLVTPLTTPTR